MSTSCSHKKSDRFSTNFNVAFSLFCLAVPSFSSFPPVCPRCPVSKQYSTKQAIMILTRWMCLLLACTIAVSRSYVIQPGTWRFRGIHPIAYETAQSVNEDNKKAEPVLLLNGFGVGSFHQHRLIHELLGDENHADRPIYCIDYLGQGTVLLLLLLSSSSS